MRTFVLSLSALVLAAAVPQNAPYAGDGRGGVQRGRYQPGWQGGGGGSGDPVCQGLAGTPQCCQLNALGACSPALRSSLIWMQRASGLGTNGLSIRSVLPVEGLRSAVLCLWLELLSFATSPERDHETNAAAFARSLSPIAL
ncbi:hypothetical protein M409DRAFT_55629 [Zasmidium cellare ATCC 36951]|uniref:Hydrophobin n=1 Tax=Zasmidium cellare ATCC 36951 TaxID=1080233 RepID=A0A6A6CF52_ZASCE|nr:uncharacterized protein M409DRAFT_55629 [Zasmidium cellare ATCC 36951]KAF2165755.1 hypothetical protein M409DRAFT_55629 [Zasmidium cellare ATCC 36951]